MTAHNKHKTYWDGVGYVPRTSRHTTVIVFLLVMFMSAVLSSIGAHSETSTQVQAYNALEEQKQKTIIVEKETPRVVLETRAQIDAYIRTVWGKDGDVGVALSECESGLDPEAANSKSTARGIFQFIKGTWTAERKRMKRSQALWLRYDPKENIETAYSHFKRNGLKQPWAESYSCVHEKTGYVEK